MPWRPLGNIAHATCTHTFEATDPDDLALQIGDEIYITEVNGSKEQWCRGWLLAKPSILRGLDAGENLLRPRAYAGIFPRSCVKIREVLDDAQQKQAHRYPQSLTNGLTNGHDVEDSESTTGLAERAVPSTNPNIARTSRESPSDLQLKPLNVSRSNGAAQKDSAPLPALKVGNSSRLAIEEPLIDDIASSMREWRSAHLHSLALQRDYAKFEDLSALVDRLNEARKKLSHNILTQQELEQLREQVVWDIVKGNKMVNGEVVVRSAAQKGRTLTAQDSITEMLDLQASMSLRDRPIPLSSKDSHLNHLLVDVTESPPYLTETAMLQMQLCSATSSGRPRPVSEAFAIELPGKDGSGIEQLPRDSVRSLFADLSAVDVGGDDQSDSRLYLICRLLIDEPFRRGTTAQAFATSRAPNYESDDDARRSGSRPGSRSGSRSGRKSFMSRSRRGSDAQESARPSTSTSMRSILHRAPQTASSTNTHSNTQLGSRPTTAEKKVRRVVGWSAVSVSSLIHQHREGTFSMAFWAPATPLDDASGNPDKGDGWDDVLRLLCKSPTGQFARADSIGRFALYLQTFAHDNVKALIAEKPALLRDIHCTPALGLNGDPNIPRNDVYLTLKQPTIPPNPRTFHPSLGSVPVKGATDLRNLQITLEVRTEDGERIEDCIYPTANRAPHTAFRTPAVDRGESWNQTIRLSIPAEQISRTHIIMSIADGPNFPFALAWVPLWDENHGFPPDGQQSLALWDYSEYTANLMDGRGAYLSLPARIDDLKEHSSNNMTALSIETYLSSTTATQNGTILALLNQELSITEDLMSLLERFLHVHDEEVVKFFTRLLVSFDNVLDQCSDLQDPDITSDEVAVATLKCLTHVFRLTRDRRYPHLDRMLDDYIQTQQCTPQSRLHILQALRMLLAKPFDARQSRDLRAALKVAESILKVTIYQNASDEDDETEFATILHRELREFFEDIIVLLTNTNHLAFPTQVVIIHNFSSWLPQLTAVMSNDQALGLAIATVDACSFSNVQLRLHRLSMIYNITHLEIFQEASLQSKLVSRTASWLRDYWIEGPDLDEKAVSALRLCCTIIKEQQPHIPPAQAQFYVSQLFDTYHNVCTSKNGQAIIAGLGGKNGRRNQFLPLFPTSYPFRTVTAETNSVPNELLLEITAVIGAFFQEWQTLNDHAAASPTNGDASMKVNDPGRALFVIRSIQNGEAFPASWLSFSVSFAHCEVTILEWLLDDLQATLPDSGHLPDAEDVLEFDEALWQLWFEALVALVSSPVVAMEHHSDQKRRAVWAIGGDIRDKAATLLQRAWLSLGWENDEDSRNLYDIERMGGYQVQFTADLIPAIIRIGLSLNHSLREVALEVLRSMIIGEWDLNGNLDVVQSAFADAFDAAFRDQAFDTSQAEILIESLQQRFANLENSPASDLYVAIMDMLQETTRLLTLLSNVHATKDEQPAGFFDQRMRLIDYLQTANNQDSYIRHIHDLSDEQAKIGNFAAAAVALQLHVNLLQEGSEAYADGGVLKAYPDLGFLAQPAPLRMIMLLSRMIEHFKQAFCWEKALTALQDRNVALQHSFDSTSLASAHQEQAAIYQMLTTGQGFKMPRYFKGTFNDNARLPAEVAGRSFIFEASPDLDTAKFARLMKEQYPQAIVLHPGATSLSAEADAPQLRITGINVHRDQLHAINQQSRISPFFRAYHLASSPSAFAASTRQEKPGVSVMEQVVQKDVFYVREQFPTLTGRSEITNEQHITLSPSQAAIDRTQRKTLDIAEAMQTVPADTSKEDDRLVRLIRASIDMSSSDSVAHYHKLLVDGGPSQGTSITGRSMTDTSTTNRDSVTDKIDETALLQEVLAIALEEHARALEEALQTCFDKRLGIKNELRNAFETTFETELAIMYPSGQWREESRAWIDPPPPPPPAVVEEAPVVVPVSHDELGSETETEQRRPRGRRRSSLRKRLSFLSLTSKG